MLLNELFKKLFLSCFAAQCSNPPGRSRCHTICDAVPALQWAETHQSHHRRQEVSSFFGFIHFSQLSCRYSKLILLFATVALFAVLLLALLCLWKISWVKRFVMFPSRVMTLYSLTIIDLPVSAATFICLLKIQTAVGKSMWLILIVCKGQCCDFSWSLSAGRMLRRRFRTFLRHLIRRPLPFSWPAWPSVELNQKRDQMSCAGWTGNLSVWWEESI